MLKTWRTWAASAGMLAGALAAPGVALAQYHDDGHCEPRPVLARIALYEELGNGQHQAIGSRQIHLLLHGFEPDHFEFEVKGFDQFGRMMPNFTFTPVLRLPAGGEIGHLEVLGGHHLRFHSGVIPVADTHVIVHDRWNPGIRTTLHVSIAEPVPQSDVEIEYGPDLVRAQPRVIETTPVYVVPTPVVEHPIGYAVPAPHCANPVYPVRRWPRHHHHSGFSLRFGGSDGDFGFGFSIRDDD